MIFQKKYLAVLLAGVLALTGCSEQGKKADDASAVSSTGENIKQTSSDVVQQKEAKEIAANVNVPSADVIKELDNMLASARKAIGLPLDGDANVRWDDVSYDREKNSVHYAYTLKKPVPSEKREEMKKAIKEETVKQLKGQAAAVCADPLTVFLLKHNIPMSYGYTDLDGSNVVNFTIDLKTICQ